MPPISQLVKETLAAYQAVADEKRRQWEEGYFPSVLRHIGVTTADAKKVMAELKTKIAGEPPETVIALAKAFADTGVLTMLHTGYALINECPGVLQKMTLDDLEPLMKVMDNWATVDVFCVYVGGQLWRMGTIPDDTIFEWARSEDRWRRRTAVVCTVPLNQKSSGGTGDPERTLAVCKMVAADKDDKVAKALSWALRELTKVDTAPVEKFLKEHETVLPAIVKREVRRKIDTGRKN